MQLYSLISFFWFFPEWTWLGFFFQAPKLWHHNNVISQMQYWSCLLLFWSRNHRTRILARLTILEQVNPINRKTSWVYQTSFVAKDVYIVSPCPLFVFPVAGRNVFFLSCITRIFLWHRFVFCQGCCRQNGTQWQDFLENKSLCHWLTIQKHFTHQPGFHWLMIQCWLTLNHNLRERPTMDHNIMDDFFSFGNSSEVENWQDKVPCFTFCELGL